MIAYPLPIFFIRRGQAITNFQSGFFYRKVHQGLVDGFVRNILDHYEDWCKSETIYQSQAWQMLFDIRLITLLLITQENKNLSQSICEVLEKIIDPFDLDVHYPHLQNSVKKSTQRLQVLINLLMLINNEIFH